MRTLTWLGIGLLLLAGCSDNKSFPQKYAQAICSKNFTCCPMSELADKTMSDCLNNNEFAVSAQVGSINESQSKGRATYDAGKTGACVDSLNAMTCDEFRQQGIGGAMEACMSFVTPKVAEGGACTQDYECVSGNCAGEDTSVDPPVDGMCGAPITLAAIGASCTGIECVDGTYCDFATSICTKLKGAGETCTSSTECVNTCDGTTGTCTCYSGCNLANGTTAGGTALSLLLFGAGVAFTRRRRFRSPRPAQRGEG